MLHVICTRLCLGHLSIRVGDGSQRSEERVKNSQIAPVNGISSSSRSSSNSSSRYLAVQVQLTRSNQVYLFWAGALFWC